jgi:hypothetical protein
MRKRTKSGGRNYSGGHYFGNLSLVDEFEYWECDECYYTEDD